MKSDSIRLRFAPAPSGFMHLGNVRTALMNYLFAKQKNGTLVLRIEDTDPKRNFDPEAKHIISDLRWLGIDYDEGPEKNGPYKPYFQSKRTEIYKEKLTLLQQLKLAYPCFCTEGELGQKRERQIALKLPPRYDRTCYTIPENEQLERLLQKIPHVWRMYVDHAVSFDIHDLARGSVHFDMHNFSDFPLTRQDGSFTFIFANFVDDMVMHISHIFRGEDHLTNTAMQAVLYKAFSISPPFFWHMPIMVNKEGKKLSKRDFGFSLKDLQSAGYCPEAISNYLAQIGTSFTQEIQSIDELIQSYDFANLPTASQIHYDDEKLLWINHKWIDRLDPLELARRCRKFLEEKYQNVKEIADEQLSKPLQIIKTDMKTLADCATVLSFYFSRPEVSLDDLSTFIEPKYRSLIDTVISEHLPTVAHSLLFVETIKTAALKNNIPIKEIFTFLRIVLMGIPKGLSIHELIDILGPQEAIERIKHGLDLLRRI